MSCKHIESFLYSSQQHKRNNIPHKYNLNRALILSHNNHKSITFLPACNLHLSVSPEIHSAYLLQRKDQGFLIAHLIHRLIFGIIDPHGSALQTLLQFTVHIQGSALVISFDADGRPSAGRKTIRIKHKCVTVAREGNPPRILPVCIPWHERL